jgi:hypothetical protein
LPGQPRTLLKLFWNLVALMLKDVHVKALVQSLSNWIKDMNIESNGIANPNL